jgi:squalene-associated FAD-dependent desaturase
MMKDKILIIGGGIAGISAAVQAIENAMFPVVVEKNRYLGGRVRSFEAVDLQKTMDNGQHVLSAAYEETSRLLKKIGSKEKIFFQKNFQALFVRSARQHLPFTATCLPAPFHFFLPLLKHHSFTQINLRDFWNFWQQSFFLSPASLRELTISQWLDKCRQGEKIRELLWRPLSLSILNTPCESGSAFLLRQAIQRSFVGSRRKAGLGIPQVWLSEIFANPAEKYIRQAGGEIHLLNTVQQIRPMQSGALQVITQKNEFEVQQVIATVPPLSLLDILVNSQLAELSELREILPQFQYHPIMTVNIFCRKSLDFTFPILLISSPLHWIFAHPHSSEGYGYAFVMSAADNWIDCSREKVMKMVENEALRLLGVDLKKDNLLLAYKIIKEKRATIAQTPQALALRPAARTALKNFYLAGDWTDTGLPTTIEGAVLSGKNAIQSILNNK